MTLELTLVLKFRQIEKTKLQNNLFSTFLNMNKQKKINKKINKNNLIKTLVVD